MNVVDALLLIDQQLAKHGLIEQGWRGTFDRARKRFGSCRYHRKLITISYHLTELNSPEEVLDTILHEIAHALAWIEHGENCGHDHRWRAICLRIGARPERCYSGQSVSRPAGNWLLINQNTGEVFHEYQRFPKRDPKTLYIRGRKEETLGKLTVIPSTQARS